MTDTLNRYTPYGLNAGSAYMNRDPEGEWVPWAAVDALHIELAEQANALKAQVNALEFRLASAVERADKWTAVGIEQGEMLARADAEYQELLNHPIYCSICGGDDE